MLDTRSSQLPDQYQLDDYQHTCIGLRQVRYPEDMPLLYRWMHAGHVVPQWQLNKPMTELNVHFEKMLADDHQRLYLISVDGQWVGYAEIYEAARDRLARYYPAEVDDFGWHLLIGELSAFGKGHLRPIVRMLSHFIFEYSPARRIVGEPDHSVKAYEVVAEALCYESQGLIHMPEKTAMLYFCERARFLATYPREASALGVQVGAER
ncbi:acetyltransferase [Pseudomonas sp. gcc21]|uniref:GNAT family N-acetyltransferase n=1 Tax=Pseudomonas sp. gcc21 TaxID=2726989 RepID=UPI0014527061|nr:GNAT family N-acetyltransferase [Pseudomonas sp. gcc21]QJD58251.1 acetyltransferase [Pseudomonas sp. gcc21]